MTAKYYWPIIALFFIQPAFSQQLSREFGVFREADMETAPPENEKDAVAMVLFDIGESKFIDTREGWYEIEFTRKKRIKILDRTGLDYAEVTIPFYINPSGRRETVENIEAFTYNRENGILVKKALDNSQVFEVKINNRYGAKKFVLPDVRPGSVIEYKYQLVTPFYFNLPDWNFQDRIPTLYSEYKVGMIPFYEYVFLLQGATELDIQTREEGKVLRKWGNVVKSYGQNVGSGIEFRDLIYTFAMKNVPSFRDESYISSADDYLVKIDFQLAKINHSVGFSEEIMSTWPKLCDDLLKNTYFGKYLSDSKKWAKGLLKSESRFQGQEASELARQLIEHVKTNFAWDQNYSKFTSKSAKDFFTQKTGNSADINLFLATLLREAGIEAYPVILSTRNHGKIKNEYPFHHFFNYAVVLVKLKDITYLADGSDALAPYNRLPPRCINEKGLIVDKNFGWVDLETTVNSLNNKTIGLEIDAESLTAAATVSIQSTEYDAYYYKNAFKDNDQLLEKHFHEEGFDNINNLKKINFEKPDKPYIIAFQADVPLEALNDNLVVSPFLNFPMKKNHLTMEERSYPVDFIYKNTQSIVSRIVIPEGYSVMNLPENLDVSDDLMDIQLEYSQSDGAIHAKGTYSLKKVIYQPGEYRNMKRHFDRIVSSFNQQVILQKN
jgi:hypothetical protein